jgi:chromosome segregation ATPase
MSDKPRWTRERKPKRRVVRAEVGKRQLREQLAAALAEVERLRFRAENCEQSTQADVVKRLQAEVERLRDEAKRWERSARDGEAVENKLNREVERLENENDGLQADLDERLTEVEKLQKLYEVTIEERDAYVVEAERLRAQVGRVEKAVEVIHGTRHASPLVDASECVVILRNALAEEVTPIQTDP